VYIQSPRLRLSKSEYKNAIKNNLSHCKQTLGTGITTYSVYRFLEQFIELDLNHDTQLEEILLISEID